MQAIKRELDPKLYSAYLAMRQEMDKSTCKRRKVGCVLTLPDGFIVARGHNSQTAGYAHVCANIPRQCGCIHAEVAAAARYYYDHITQLVPLTAVITCAPCMTCYHALRLINVKTMWFMENSDPGFEVVEFAQDHYGVTIQQFDSLDQEMGVKAFVA